MDDIDMSDTIADLVGDAAVDALRDEISRFHAIGMALVNLTEDADGMQTSGISASRWASTSRRHTTRSTLSIEAPHDRAHHDPRRNGEAAARRRAVFGSERPWRAQPLAHARR
jgi:hypothetical protein